MSDQPIAATGTQAGQPATPAQPPASLAPDLQALADQIFSRTQSYLDKRLNTLGVAAPTTAQPAPAADAGQPNDEPTAWAKQLEAVRGVALDESDPEAGMIDHTSADTFKDTYAAALLAKKHRIAQANQPKPTPAAATPTNAGGAGNPVPPATEDDYRREMLANRGKGAALTLIKEKYRKLGIDVDQVSFRGHI